MDDDAINNFNKLDIENRSGQILILNEGNFNYSNASLSSYNLETKEVINDVFFKVNGIPLGDVAHSIAIKDSLAYVVINNSGKVLIINTNTLKLTYKITGLTSPRFIHFINNHKAYISDLYSKEITIFDPMSNTITGSISVSNHSEKFNQHSTEQFLQYNNKVLVNCWSNDNKILIIDSEKDKLIDSITVALQPNSMAIDENNKLWVLCDGAYETSPYGHVHASLLRINLENKIIEKQFTFQDKKASPNALTIYENKIFYNYTGSGGSKISNAGIYSMATTSSELPSTPIIDSESNNITGFYIDYQEGDFYLTDAKNFLDNGEVYRYTKKLDLIDTIKTGIIPSHITFY